MTIYAHVS